MSYTEAKAAHVIVLDSEWDTHFEAYLIMDDFYHDQFDNNPEHWRIDARRYDPVVLSNVMLLFVRRGSFSKSIG